MSVDCTDCSGYGPNCPPNREYAALVRPAAPRSGDSTGTRGTHAAVSPSNSGADRATWSPVRGTAVLARAAAAPTSMQQLQRCASCSAAVQAGSKGPCVTICVGCAAGERAVGRQVFDFESIRRCAVRCLDTHAAAIVLTAQRLLVRQRAARRQPSSCT